jgi:hypothetical protein
MCPGIVGLEVYSGSCIFLRKTVTILMFYKASCTQINRENMSQPDNKEWFHNLKIIGSYDEIENLIHLIEHNLHNGWTRNKDMEDSLERGKLSLQTERIFTHYKADKSPRCNVYFSYDKNQHLKLLNIRFPSEDTNNVENENNETRQNIILQEFYDTFISPYYQEAGVRIKYDKEISVDSSMSENVAQAFKSFTFVANKSSLHPHDQERCYDFIIQAHIDGSLLEEDEIAYLLKIEGWWEEKSIELSSDYRFGRDLLNRFNNSHG